MGASVPSRPQDQPGASTREVGAITGPQIRPGLLVDINQPNAPTSPPTLTKGTL